MSSMWAHIATNTIRLRGLVKLDLNLKRKNRKGRNYLFSLALGPFSDVIIEDCLIIEASFNCSGGKEENTGSNAG